jgi:hypothetical protein
MKICRRRHQRAAPIASRQRSLRESLCTDSLILRPSQPSATPVLRFYAKIFCTAENPLIGRILRLESCEALEHLRASHCLKEKTQGCKNPYYIGISAMSEFFARVCIANAFEARAMTGPRVQKCAAARRADGAYTFR